MVDKRESYTKEDLLASGRGELFGAKGPQLPAPNMLMMDRVVKMTETGGNFDKGYVEAELDSEDQILTLSTCTDFNDSKRFIVCAKLIEVNSNNN